MNPDFTWLLLVFSKGGAGSRCCDEEAELLSLSLPSLRLTLWKKRTQEIIPPEKELLIGVNQACNLR